ncbi:hypothetical protein V1Y59_18090 [Gordonia sp. PKS22-38]|uniref:Uncharacterized protein n=1 Tax=Gordonia prachuapensis TaxID=3115651 RepID=A0ABU7MXD9_9ACTN|nr:hypothetical protein [Gordonia sp. PKS22-38]
MRDFDFDSAVDDAWREFRADLADRLASLQVGERHTVRASHELGVGPCAVLTFTVTKANRVRCTAHASDLDPTPHVLAEQLDVLESAGWRLLRDGRMITEVGRRRVDELAQVAIDALRQPWEVLHPAFLTGPAPARPEASVAVGVYPTSREHLLRLVSGALEEIAGRPVAVDADGDIPLPTGTMPSWLRVVAQQPTVEFFATLVDEVPDATAAAEFIARESVRWPGITLVLHQTTLTAFSSVEMAAFHRENLVAGIRRWLEFIAESSPQVIEAITGAGRPEASDAEQLPDPLQTLIVLDDDGSTLDAHEVATICGHDQSAILGYIRTSQEQYLEWMKSAAEADLAGDADEASACRHEEQAWRATTEQLRAALRVVVLRGHSSSEQVREG